MSAIRTQLPDVQHPAFRLGDPEDLCVRGVSRETPRVSQNPQQRESALPDRLRINQLDSWRQLDHWANLEKKYREREGNEETEEFSKTAQSQPQSEELEHQLFEKINSGGFYPLKNLFLANDPEGRGRVKRDALPVILAAFLGQFVSGENVHQLLQRLHLGGKHIVTFDAFYEHFKRAENKDPPDWLDPMKRKQKPALRTAHEVHLSLKETAGNRFFEILKLFPNDRLDSCGFRSALHKSGIAMTEKEFRKLWNRYVGDGGRVLSSDHLLSQLGVVNSRNADDHRSALLSALQKVSGSHRNPQPQTSKAAPSKRADERKLSLSIERWLKENFREGARAMAAEFGALDPEKKGKVSKDDFLTVLDRFNLHLAKDQLAHFLARCGIDESSPSVNYLEFLRRSQSRSKNGVSNQIWGHGAYRLENRNPSRSRSASGVFEEKLIPLLHSDFVSLLHAFQRADPKQLNVISQQDFRTIIEQKYAIKVTEEEFAGLLEKLPVDHRGGIRYLEFMSRFDGSDGRLSLFDGGRTVLTEYSKKPNNPIKTRDPQKGRSAEQLEEIIKHLVKNNYGSLETAFSQMDDMKARRLTSESMYQLLKRCDVQPQITREEVGKIWDALILNQDRTVDFFQFVRHFGFSAKSSCFPNAKISPPVRGDGDFLIRSNKLNSDTKITANVLQSKVKLLLDELSMQFTESDPLNSGYVTKEEFLDVLRDLSPDLTKHQCDSLAAKFGDGQNRVSYVKFLEPYKSERSSYQRNAVRSSYQSNAVRSSYQRNAMRSSYQRNAVRSSYQRNAVRSSYQRNAVKSSKKAAEESSSQTQRGLNAATSNLRQKLSRTDWRNLYQACQKLDRDGSGTLQLPEFRSVVKLCNVVLDENEFYQIMSQYDKDLAGKIDYSKLFSDQK